MVVVEEQEADGSRVRESLTTPAKTEIGANLPTMFALQLDLLKRKHDVADEVPHVSVIR
jgi:hypothetical protein